MTFKVTKGVCSGPAG